MVILTSFSKASQFRGVKYSVARFQPKGIRFKPLDFFFPKEGLITNDVMEYEKRVTEIYQSREKAIKEWIESLKRDVDVVLCCWCPYSRRAEKQLQDEGYFICHTGIIGKLIQNHRKDIKVVMDEDREIAMHKKFRILPHKCVECEINLQIENEEDCLWHDCCAGPYLYNEETGRITAVKYATYFLKKGE